MAKLDTVEKRFDADLRLQNALVEIARLIGRMETKATKFEGFEDAFGSNKASAMREAANFARQTLSKFHRPMIHCFQTADWNAIMNQEVKIDNWKD